MSDALFGSTYVDVPQTGVAVRRLQWDKRFVATRMVPKIIVKKPSGLYTVVNMGDLNRDEMEARGPSAAAAKAGWRTKKKTFSTDARSLAYDLNDAEAAASDVETNPETLIPRVLGYKALLHMERRMSIKFFAAGTWDRNVTGAAATTAGDATARDQKYLDDSGEDPIDVFSDEIRILSNLTGAEPATMGLTLGSRLWHKIRNHPKVKAQIASTLGSTTGLIALARAAELPELAKLLGIRQCLVSTAIYNTAVMTSDADAVSVNSPIVPQDDALLYVNPFTGDENADAGMTVDSDTPAAFCRPVWNGVASDEGMQIRKFRDEKAGPSGSWSHVIDVYQGFEVVSSECGVRFTGMVTP